MSISYLSPPLITIVKGSNHHSFEAFLIICSYKENFSNIYNKQHLYVLYNPCSCSDTNVHWSECVGNWPPAGCYLMLIR